MLGLGLKRMFGINRGGLSLPFAQNLLGAWLHKKAPQETTILDERSGIDKTREPIRGQGLKFTGVQHITHPYQLTNGSDDFSFECEVIFDAFGGSRYLFDARGVYNNDSITLYANSGSVIQLYFSTNVIIETDVLSVNVRYLVSLNFFEGDITLIITGDDGYAFTQTVTDTIPVSASTLFIGTRYTLASYLQGTLGWYRITKNGVTTIECALEDGPTVILFNRIQPSFQGTIQGATLSTFRVEDDRITNGGNGSYWNQEGGTVSGSVRIPRLANGNTDVLGQPLTYTKPAAINLQMVNSNCGYLFEALSRFNHSSITVNDFTIIFYANLDLVLNQETQFRSLYGDGSSDVFYLQSDGLYFRAAGTTNTTSSFWSGGDFTAEDFTGWKIFVATRNFQTGVISLTVNGKTKTATETNSLGFGFTSSGFATSNGQSFDGELMYSCMYNRILTEEEINNWNPFLPPQEGLELFHLLTAGAGTLIPDISGNGRHGILAGTTLSTFWSKKQDVFHWNIRKGFTEVYWLDGVDDYIELNTQISLTGDFFIDFEFFNTTAITYVFSSGGEYLRISSGILQFRIDSNINNITSGVLLGFHTGRLQRVSGVITCIFDGVEYPVVSSATTVDVISLGTHVNSFISSIIQSININNEYTGSGITWPDATISGSPAKIKLPLTLGNGQYTNPAGKWHNGAETEFNAPSCPELVIANKQFDTGFWYYLHKINKEYDFSSTTDGLLVLEFNSTGASLTANNDAVSDGTTSYDNVLILTCGSKDGANNQTYISINLADGVNLQGDPSLQNQKFDVLITYRLPTATTGVIDGIRVWTGWGGEGTLYDAPGSNNWKTVLLQSIDLREIGDGNSLRIQVMSGSDWRDYADCNGEQLQIAELKIIQHGTLRDIQYADIVDNYEDADTLFADVAEDNKRMKLLQYKNPLTE